MTEQSVTDQRRQQFIEDLRACAAFLEAHPSVPAPVYVVMNVFGVKTRDAMADVARMASWTKVYNGEWFSLKKDFGRDVRLEINAARELVCRKVLTGISTTIPAQPERTVEEFEWVCDDGALLAGGAR